jgi:hypothetical protein
MEVSKFFNQAAIFFGIVFFTDFGQFECADQYLSGVKSNVFNVKIEF